MANNIPINKKLTALRGRELCEFIIKLCDSVKQDAGTEFRGGIYPSNVFEGPNGEITIGPANEYNWTGEELKFIAPELYWNSKRSPASDVYSIGLLMYYAFSGGRIPYEGECDDPVLRRMTDDAIPVPHSAGRRMGEIIAKALSFKASERFQSMDELKAVVSSCNSALFLNGAPTAETVLKKSDDSLSDVERMMVAIIEGSGEQKAEPPHEDVKVYAPEKATEAAVRRAPSARRPGEMPSAPTNRARVGANAERASVSPAIQYTSEHMERERQLNRAMKRRRRRPIIVILVLCVLLISAALLFNRLTNGGRGALDVEVDFTEQMPTPTPTPDAPVEDIVISTPEPTPEPPREHSYELFLEDVSWTEAKARCEEKGGHLVVINDAEELQRIIELADEKGVNRLWIGCYRENNSLVWVNGDSVTFYQWGAGEPSAYDKNDDVTEDYVMLWYLNGWVYNDSRNDPIKDYPEMYSGKLAYVCEFE